MKSRKFLVLAACVFAAASAFSEGLPENPADWPAQLGMTPKMLLLVVQIGIILFAARLGGIVAAKLKLPSVLGELGAGIAIGPWALGGVPIPGFDGLLQHGVFYGHALRAQMAANPNVSPFAATPELYGLCTIASVVLLFLSGIETNLKMFLRYAFAGSLVGVGGVVFSFLFGDLAAVYATTLMPETLGGIKCLAELGALVQAGELTKAILSPAALFMGIMSTATSVGITARILSERKKMDSEEGVTIMAGAVIDDVLGIIVLAIGMGIIGSQRPDPATGAVKPLSWGAIGLTAVKAFGVWLGGTVVGVVCARRISGLLKAFRTPSAIATLALALALIVAGLFEMMGLTLIIGAYVLGLSLSRTDLKHPVQENLSTIYAFLVPVFFCVMGMMVDVTALCSKPVLIFGGIYTVLAVFAKVIGCAIPSLFCGFTPLGALRIGAGMIPRGEVALIIAGIGLSNGFLTSDVFGIGILMTLATTVVAPPALVALFIPKASGVRRPNAALASAQELCFGLPGSDIADYAVTRLLDEFRNEGFFTSLLSKDDNIWEVAMDEMDITVRRENRKIFIRCTPDEKPLVMAAWVEVSSRVSDLARTITQSTQTNVMMTALAGNIATPTPPKKPARNIAHYLRGFVMLPGFRASSKEEAVAKIVAEIAKTCPNHVTDADAAVKAVLKREASMPTGLDHGIALPHGRDASVRGIAGAVALVDNSGTAGGCLADYETIDKSPVSIVVLTLASDQDQTPYLQLMGFISRALRAPGGCDRLLACKTAEEMRTFFRKT